jgi:hypothetical protein
VRRLLTVKFKGTLRSFRINLQAYKRTLHEHLSNEIVHAAFLWLNAVLMEIPVWSGASHATFLRLARQVGYQLTISPSVVSRIPYGQRHGDGEVVADQEKGRYLFRYETDLEHLIYNEFNNANITPDPALFYRLRKPGPYHFQKKGIAAFEEHAKSVRLPSPWKSLKVTTRKVS